MRTNLSFRENEVVNLLLKGLSNRAIAQRLDVSEKTVKFHLTNIFKIAGVKSRMEFAAQHADQNPTVSEIGLFKSIL